jgi:hypothetical protein
MELMERMSTHYCIEQPQNPLLEYISSRRRGHLEVVKLLLEFN